MCALHVERLDLEEVHPVTVDDEVPPLLRDVLHQLAELYLGTQVLLRVQRSVLVPPHANVQIAHDQ